MEQIERCPQCGCEPRLIEKPFQYVRCPNPLCNLEGEMFDGHPEDAIASWNAGCKIYFTHAKQEGNQ